MDCVSYHSVASELQIYLPGRFKYVPLVCMYHSICQGGPWGDLARARLVLGCLLGTLLRCVWLPSNQLLQHLGLPCVTFCSLASLWLTPQHPCRSVYLSVCCYSSARPSAHLSGPGTQMNTFLASSRGLLSRKFYRFTAQHLFCGTGLCPL